VGDHRLDRLGREPDRVVVGDQVAGGGVGQDQRGRAVRLGPGEKQRHRTGRRAGGQQRGSLRAGCVHDRDQLLHIRLPQWQRVGWQRVGGAGATPVEAQQPREARQPMQEQRHLRVVPDEVDVAEGAHGEHQVGRALPEHLVGELV
jgi:hypothetical protein